MKQKTLSSALSHYQFDVHNHHRPLIRAMREELGPFSEWIYIKLHCLILSMGHYVVWDNFALRDIANTTGTSEELVEQTLEWLLNNGVFDRRLLEEEHVLTGLELQRFFFTVTLRRKETEDRLKYRLYEGPISCNLSAENAASSAASNTAISRKRGAKTAAKRRTTCKKTTITNRSKAAVSEDVAADCTQLSPNSEVKGSEVKGNCLPTMVCLPTKNCLPTIVCLPTKDDVLGEVFSEVSESAAEVAAEAAQPEPTAEVAAEAAQAEPTAEVAAEAAQAEPTAEAVAEAAEPEPASEAAAEPAEPEPAEAAAEAAQPEPTAEAVAEAAEPEAAECSRVSEAVLEGLEAESERMATEEGSAGGEWVGLSPEQYRALPDAERRVIERASAKQMYGFGKSVLWPLTVLKYKLLSRELWCENACRTLHLTPDELRADIDEFIDELRLCGDDQARDMHSFQRHFGHWHKWTKPRRKRGNPVNNQQNTETHGCNARFKADRDYKPNRALKVFEF